MENNDYEVILIFNSHQFNCFEKRKNWVFSFRYTTTTGSYTHTYVIMYSLKTKWVKWVWQSER
jgi:hypothetical protein